MNSIYKIKNAMMIFNNDMDKPIFDCCISNNFGGLKLIIESGAKLNVENAFSQTPLFAAIEAGSLECVKCLIEAGESPWATNLFGDTTLIFAFRNGCLDIEKYLLGIGIDGNIKDSFYKSYFDYINENSNIPHSRIIKIFCIMKKIRPKRKCS